MWYAVALQIVKENMRCYGAKSPEYLQRVTPPAHKDACSLPWRMCARALIAVCKRTILCSRL